MCGIRGMGLKLDWVPKQISNVYKAPPPSFPISSFSPPLPWLPSLNTLTSNGKALLPEQAAAALCIALFVPHLTVLAFFGAALAFELSQAQRQRIAASAMIAANSSNVLDTSLISIGYTQTSLP